MTLTSQIIARYFDGDGFALGLAKGSREIRAGGYERTVNTWTRDESEARTLVSFGPFREDVEFDSVLIFENGDLVDDVLTGRVALPAGTIWEQAVLVTISEMSA